MIMVQNGDAVGHEAILPDADQFIAGNCKLIANRGARANMDARRNSKRTKLAIDAKVLWAARRKFTSIIISWAK
jgi:hypothetical protein